MACYRAALAAAVTVFPISAHAQAAVGRRDSAGITIVTSARLGPRVTAREVLRLGDVNGGPTTTFFQIRDVRLRADGGLVVLDAGDRVVKVFDRAGRLAAFFGGAGEGPAEFGSPWLLALAADTIHVLDIGLGKVASFSPRGDLLRTQRLAAPVTLVGFPVSWAIRPDGSLLVVGQRGCGFPKRPDDNAWGLYALGPDGRMSDTLAQERLRTALPVYVREGRVRSCSVFPWPFAPGPTLALDPAGGAYRSPGAGYEISRLDSTLMRVTAVMRYPGPRRPVTRAERREFARLLDERRELDAALRRAAEAAADSAGFPDAWPAVAALLVGEPGVVWAQRAHAISSTEQEWDVLDDGAHVATVVLPAAVKVTAVRGDRVAGTVKDELDVEYAVVYVVPRRDGR